MKYIYPAALAAAVLIVLGAVYLQKAPPTITTTPAEPVATSTTTLVPAPSTYTLGQIAQHNSKASCWTTINGSVYDLTTFIPMHPGGERILVVCGVDGTSAFLGQHSRTPEAQAELATLKIGTLAR